MYGRYRCNFNMISVLILLSFSLTVPVLSEVSIKQYTTENFNKNIKENPGTFVMFYAPWCTHCTVFHPIWNQLAEMLNFPGSEVTIAQVDCTTELNLCRENDITGYPTLLYFKQKLVKPSEYRGTRDLPSLTLFLSEVMTDSTEDEELIDKLDDVKLYKGMFHLTDQNFDKFVSKGRHFIFFYAPWCTVSQTLAPNWSALARRYEKNETIKISKIDCAVHGSTCLNFDIKDYPHLIWMVDGKVMEAITGYRTLDELEKFVETMALPENHNPERFTRKKAVTPVARVTEETFRMYMEQDLVFINYFTGWCAHCKLMVPTWTELAKIYQEDSRIIIADVDCGHDKLCVQEEIQHFPTLILYKNGKMIYEHKGSTTLEDLKLEVEKHVNDSKQTDIPSTEKDEL